MTDILIINDILYLTTKMDGIPLTKYGKNSKNIEKEEHIYNNIQ